MIKGKVILSSLAASAIFASAGTMLFAEDTARPSGEQKVHKENPDICKDEFNKKQDIRKDEQDAKINELVDKYRKSQTEEGKAKVKGEIRRLIKEEFDRKMESNRQHIEQAEKQLQEYKAGYEDRKKNANQIIEGRINDLIKDPNLKW